MDEELIIPLTDADLDEIHGAFQEIYLAAETERLACIPMDLLAQFIGLYHYVWNEMSTYDDESGSPYVMVPVSEMSTLDEIAEQIDNNEWMIKYNERLHAEGKV